MKKDSYNTKIMKTSRFLVVFSLFVITTSFVAFIISDLLHYSSSDKMFSMWQVPLATFLLCLFSVYYIYMIFRVNVPSIFALTLLITLFVLLLPYEKVGDFRRLRDLSVCEGDGRRCRENLYPYLTQEWCIENGYRFDESTKYCHMRASSTQ
jgi:hypothetical protein